MQSIYYEESTGRLLKQTVSKHNSYENDNSMQQSGNKEEGKEPYSMKLSICPQRSIPVHGENLVFWLLLFMFSGIIHGASIS